MSDAIEKVGDIVEVAWVDSWSAHGWVFPNDIYPDPAVHCRTVGFLHATDEKGVHIIATKHRDGTGSVNQHIGIPRQSITGIQVLKSAAEVQSS